MLFNISRKPGSVPVQMQLVRENWEVAVSKVGPLEVGEAVVFTHGPGTVEVLHPGSGITVKAEFEKSFTFMSDGTCFELFILSLPDLFLIRPLNVC